MPAPANDNVANAVTITLDSAGVYTATPVVVDEATTEAWEVTLGIVPEETLGRSVWWKFTPSADASMRLDSADAHTYVAVLQLPNGIDPTTAPWWSNFDETTGWAFLVGWSAGPSFFGVKAGLTYYFVADTDESPHSAGFTLTGPPPPPPPPPPPSTPTDTADLAGGRMRVGTGENLTVVPVLPVPEGLTVARMQVVAQQMPTPVLKNGVPK